jgi:hypothetical protein
MTTNAECYQVHQRPVEKSMNRRERLVALTFYFTSILAEDQIDGTSFDCAVVDAIQGLENKYFVE